jgi:hypothetical protein
MSGNMKQFKDQLQELKRKGADIDPEEIIKDLTTPPTIQVVDEFEISFDKQVFGLLKEKVMKILEDFESFYGPKGRGLSVAIHIQKENSADRYSETFPYTENQSIVHIVDIGTKGKYEPVIPKKIEFTVSDKDLEDEKKEK